MTSTYEFSRVIDHKPTSLNRNNGFQLKNGTTIETQASYAFSPPDGRLSQISNPQISNQQFTYQYLSNSDLLEKVTGPAHEVVNTYEPNRDVLDTKTNKLVSTVISAYDYAVNAIGQRTGVSTSGTAFPNVPTWIWGYDSLGQVTSADSSVNASDPAYQYDAIGNRKKTADSLTLPPADNYTANALNQYSSIGNQPSAIVNPTYDFDGNATSYPLPTSPTTNSTLVWDAENRFVEVKNAAGTTLETNLFDSSSRKIATTANGVNTLYLYDAWNCIAEYKLHNSSLNLHTSRLWGMDLSGSMQGAGGVGGLLCESHISDPQSPIYYPLYDGNGNTSEYLDSSGQVTAHFEYDPFGNTVVNTDSSNQFAYRFSTKPLAFASGLYYYGYRWYNPLTGRWPSRDTIGERGGVNLYGFVGNSGTNSFDLLGLIERTPGGHHVFAFAELEKHPGISECIKEELEKVQIPTQVNESGKHHWTGSHSGYNQVSKEAMDNAIESLKKQGIDVSKDCPCGETMTKITDEFKKEIDKNPFAKAYNSAVNNGVNDTTSLNQLYDDYLKNGKKKDWLKTARVGGKLLGKMVSVVSIVSLGTSIAEGDTIGMAENLPGVGLGVEALNSAVEAIADPLDISKNPDVQEMLEENRRLLDGF